jgi:hypothetical protein
MHVIRVQKYKIMHYLLMLSNRANRSSFPGANSCRADQDITCVLRHRTARYHVRLPLDRVQSVPPHVITLRSVLSGSLLSNTQFKVLHLITHMRATYPPIRLYPDARVTYGNHI